MDKRILAFRLIGRPIRIVSVKGEKRERIAILRFEVTPYAKDRNRQGVSVQTIGCELSLIILRPREFARSCKKVGENTLMYRIRNLTPRQLRTLAIRLLEYAELLEIASVLGVSVEELRKTWNEIKSERTTKKKKEKEETEFEKMFEEVEEEEETEEEGEEDVGTEDIERD